MNEEWIDFDYALIRLVPCVHRGNAFNVGVVLHAPSKRYLRALFLEDLSPLESLAGDLDLARVARYLAAFEAVADGREGPLAQLSPSERFHWLTAPRSDVLQATAIHPGRALDLDEALLRVFRQEVSLSR